MCTCGGWMTTPARTAPGIAAVTVGERGLLLLEAGPAERTNHRGPVTGTRYRFDERARLWVDRRDAVYFVGVQMRLVDL